ncbi:MAG TPA: HD-GYP domain-containing protein [Chloroflexota bacterium]|nr:HD-GYP domain-containing protein [Chloroflexota bacterium]
MATDGTTVGARLKAWRRVGAALPPQPGVSLATAALAALSLFLGWLRSPASPGGLPLPTMVLAISLAGAVVVSYKYPIHIRHQIKVNLFTVAYYLLAVLVTPLVAAAAAGVGSLCGEVSARRISGAFLSDIVTEAGRRIVIVMLSALVAQTTVSAMPWPVALVAAAVVMAALDTATLPLVLAPMGNDSPFHVLAATAREIALPEGMQYCVGLIGAMAAAEGTWILALLAIPAGLIYKAFKILRELQDSTRHLLENMADAVDLRDPYTGGHSRRVTEYSGAILRQLGIQGPEVTLIVAAARVHDIGKIGIPDAILNKAGRLTDEERLEMEAHPVYGESLLKRHADFARGTKIVRHHHERWDGAGYPDGLRGTDIPFGARVVAVADSYDAMTSDRPYRRGMSIQDAAAILQQGREHQWDAAIVDAFLRALTAEHRPEAGQESPAHPSRLDTGEAPRAKEAIAV